MKRYLLCILVLALATIHALGQGAYVEYKMTISKGNRSGTIKTYYLDGNARTETNLQIPGMPNGFNIVTISLKDNPDTAFMLNEKNKTFSPAMSKGNIGKNANYEVTVLGKENVDGYDCTHVKVINDSTKDEAEIWTSKNVVDYAFFKSVKNKYLDGNKIYSALAAKDADGFAVKIIAGKGGKTQVQLDLVKAEKQNVDRAKVSLDGYTRGAAESPFEQMKEQVQQQQH